MEIKKDFILKFLKHKDPFLFIDESLYVDEHKSISRYSVDKSSYFFKGHFPGHAILPGVLMIEMMSQASLLHIIVKNMIKDIGFYDNNSFHYNAYLAKVDSFMFKSMVEPNTTLDIHIVVKPSLMINFFEVNGQIFDGKFLKSRGNLFVYFMKDDLK